MTSKYTEGNVLLYKFHWVRISLNNWFQKQDNNQNMMMKIYDKVSFGPTCIFLEITQITTHKVVNVNLITH